MDKNTLRTLLVYEGENGAVFKTDVLLAMLMPSLSPEQQKIVQEALEIKAEIDKQKVTQSSSGIA